MPRLHLAPPPMISSPRPRRRRRRRGSSFKPFAGGERDGEGVERRRRSCHFVPGVCERLFAARDRKCFFIRRGFYGVAVMGNALRGDLY